MLARSTYWALHRHFPTRAAKILASLDPSTHRLVLQEKDHYAARALNGGGGGGCGCGGRSGGGTATARPSSGRMSGRPVAEREAGPAAEDGVQGTASRTRPQGTQGAPPPPRRAPVGNGGADSCQSSRPTPNGGGGAVSRRVGPAGGGARRVPVANGKASDAYSQRDTCREGPETSQPGLSHREPPQEPYRHGSQLHAHAREGGLGDGAARRIADVDGGLMSEMEPMDHPYGGKETAQIEDPADILAKASSSVWSVRAACCTDLGKMMSSERSNELVP